MCSCSCFLSCLRSWISRASLATIFLWTAGILCGTSLVSSQWMKERQAYAYTRGLFGGKCNGKDVGLLVVRCVKTQEHAWVWEDGFELEINMPEWLIATQLIFLSGLLLLLPALLISPFRFVCCRKSVGISKVLSIVTFFSSCLLTGAVVCCFYNIVWTENDGIKAFLTVKIWSIAIRLACAGACFTLGSSILWHFDSIRKIESVTSDKKNQQNV